MMKLIVFGAVAFLLGAGGSTGVLVLTAPAVPAGADSLAAHRAPDKDAHGGAAAGPHHELAAPDSAAAGHGTTPPAHAGGHADPSPDAHVAAIAPREAVVRPIAIPGMPERPPAPSPSAEGFKSVGNILMNMKPAESAKILAYLNDAQVEGLLRSMSPRNAASVLSQMPAERAAALSKRLLVASPPEDAR